MAQGAGADGGLQREQFLPMQELQIEHVPSATAKPDYFGKAKFLCRRFPVLVVGVVILSVLLISFTTATIVLAGKLKQCSSPAAACVPPDPCPEASIPRDPCPEGWIWFKGKCYFFSNFSTDWDKAQAFCVSYSASLAHIETQQELDFSMRYKGLSDHWIALRREEGQVWRWTDGSGLNSPFNNLAQESGCAYLNDVSPRTASCTMNRNWICTKPGYSRF